MDQFADRNAIVTPYFDSSKYVVHGVLENNNSPIVETPVVNFSGIGKYQTTETQKPSTSTNSAHLLIAITANIPATAAIPPIFK